MLFNQAHNTEEGWWGGEKKALQNVKRGSERQSISGRREVKCAGKRVDGWGTYSLCPYKSSTFSTHMNIMEEELQIELG